MNSNEVSASSSSKSAPATLPACHCATKFVDNWSFRDHIYIAATNIAPTNIASANIGSIDNAEVDCCCHALNLSCLPDIRPPPVLFLFLPQTSWIVWPTLDRPLSLSYSLLRQAGLPGQHSTICSHTPCWLGLNHSQAYPTNVCPASRNVVTSVHTSA